MKRSIAVLLTAAPLFLGCAPLDTGGDATVLTGGLLIDGTGAPPVEDGVVVMRGGRIVGAGAAGTVEVPANATMIDVAGKTIMPGMIEGNSHIIFDGQSNHPAYFAGRYRDYYEIGARNLNASLMQGITTSRDTMDPLEEMIRLREDVESGLIAGSRLFTSGTILNYPGVYRMFDDPTDSVFEGIPAEGVEYARAAMRLPVRDGAHGREIVADYAERGADFIKVSSHSGPENIPPELSTEALTEIVEEAHARGLRVTTHTSSIPSIVAVLDAGVDAMEHPTLVAEEEVGPQGEFPDELVQRFVDQNVYSVSLMVVREVYVTYLEDPSRLEDRWYIRHAPADMVQEAREWVARDLASDPEALAKQRAGYELGRENLAKLIAAGAPIAMGTDKGTRLNFHESGNHVREIEIFTELGMTPMEAIVSATRRGAELLGMEEEFGTIEPGKLADVIVVDGNPLEDIWALRDVDLVFKEGVRYR
ncbi:MAG: amidohydrolase family protein [Gemmatimonadetes bacterium]|nr:amidohydrolase family protein [Gemmatimonadota bacterium]MYC93107.1 amidohydrolase family protein [Gemmatimonadota bacterium]MYJ18005.1 amidohydrolase family protein [Gemmatimonadota bacterium]